MVPSNTGTDGIWIVQNDTTAQKQLRLEYNGGADVSQISSITGSTGALRGLILNASNIFINDASNASMAGPGLTINQGGSDNEILSLKSSDMAHGMTSFSETDTYGAFAKARAANGGLDIYGFTASGGTGLGIRLIAGTDDAADTTKATNALGQIHLYASVKTGTGLGDVGANGNLATIGNRGVARFIFDAEGTGHADDVWTDNAFDLAEEYDISEFSGEGTVLVVDPSIKDRLMPSTAIGQVPVGVISFHTAQLGSSFGNINEKYPQLGLRYPYDIPQPVALVGRVPVKITTEEGPIKIGDRITPSSLKGYGMKAATSGYTVAMALDNWDGSTSTTTAIVNGQEIKTGLVLAYVNVGYSKLDKEVSQLTSVNGPDNAWSVDQQSGKVNVNFFGSLNLNGNDIINVSKIIGMDGKWKIDETGKLIAREIEVEKLKVTSPSGFTIFDEDTKQPVCVKSKNLAITLVAGECGENAPQLPLPSPGETSTTTATTTEQ
jgi:hypothetical protein